MAVFTLLCGSFGALTVGITEGWLVGAVAQCDVAALAALAALLGQWGWWRC